MMGSFSKDLFVLDLANNHFGDVQHAKSVIVKIANEIKTLDLQVAIKFQFRDLSTFIHPAFSTRTDIKYINRFKSTELSVEDFAELVNFSKAYGFKTISTPFDETSVELVRDLKLDYVKVASASADDYPLLRRVTSLKQPIIASTGGLRLDQIDRLVSVIESSNNEFAIMHCVSIYPSPSNVLVLNQIKQLQKRYPYTPIGWSTHEDPSDLRPIAIATSMGARIFERHIGEEAKDYPLNKYSSSPIQIRSWLEAYLNTRSILGAENRVPSSEEEIKSLRELKRSVFLSRDVEEGEIVHEKDVFYAIPSIDEAYLAGEIVFPIRATKKLSTNDYLYYDSFETIQSSEESLIIASISSQVRGLLNDAKVVIDPEIGLEISHHYGLARFREFGCCFFTCVNEEYAKKILIMLPRQKHPLHHHKKKKETFQLLSGDLEVEVDGHRTIMGVGSLVTVEAGQWHKFQTLNGAVIEEISTHHYSDDSFYDDHKIQLLPKSLRKTLVSRWVSYQTNQDLGLEP